MKKRRKKTEPNDAIAKCAAIRHLCDVTPIYSHPPPPHANETSRACHLSPKIRATGKPPEFYRVLLDDPGAFDGLDRLKPVAAADAKPIGAH